jgi:hypothetical protein
VGDVVPVREASQRLGIDRRHLSRLLHRGDVPTDHWGADHGRWVDVEAVAAALAARRNGGGRKRVRVELDGRARPELGEELFGGDVAAQLRAAGQAAFAEAVALARATADRLARVDVERRELERERRRLEAERQRLAEAARRHHAARAGYEQRRAELSAALARAGREAAGR